MTVTAFKFQEEEGGEHFLAFIHFQKPSPNSKLKGNRWQESHSLGGKQWARPLQIPCEDRRMARVTPDSRKQARAACSRDTEWLPTGSGI